MVWDRNAPYKAESKKIVWTVAPYLRGRGLDIGAGDFKVLPHVISVDNMNHAQFGFSVRPDVMCEATKLEPFASCSMDFVYSSHTLEHVEDTAGTLREWWRVVKQGGYLLLYLPHDELYPKVGESGANPDHKVNLNEQVILDAMPDGWDLIKNERRNEDDEYSFLMIFKKIGGRANKETWKLPKPAKTACIVRYGAFGDVLQASSVVKGLKDQGYHVSLFAAPPGVEIIRTDPNVDVLVEFDKDQVPNGDLSEFWNCQKKNFDKWVNLSESVEGTFLAIPGRTNDGWSPFIRHRMLNVNYLEFAHQMAEVPHKPQVKFYPTLEEKQWAKKERAKYKGPVVMWSMAGSAVHKTWAGMDHVIASIMLHYPEVHVVLVGGPECVILEKGWENEPRVHRMSGKWSIRQTLSFLNEVDLLIGPETGVLNAACCMPLPKLIFLSHSSEENLTRDWVNTTALWSRKTICAGRSAGVPACHRLIYGWTDGRCTRHESGVAQCMADLTVEEVWREMDFQLLQIVDKVAA